MHIIEPFRLFFPSQEITGAVTSFCVIKFGIVLGHSKDQISFVEEINGGRVNLHVSSKRCLPLSILFWSIAFWFDALICNSLNSVMSQKAKSSRYVVPFLSAYGDNASDKFFVK